MISRRRFLAKSGQVAAVAGLGSQLGLRRLVHWVDEFWRVMGPHTSNRSPQNFIDPALTDWLSGYYGSNLERLVNVKRAVDPTDTFHFAQSIPTRV